MLETTADMTATRFFSEEFSIFLTTQTVVAENTHRTVPDGKPAHPGKNEDTQKDHEDRLQVRSSVEATRLERRWTGVVACRSLSDLHGLTALIIKK